MTTEPTGSITPPMPGLWDIDRWSVYEDRKRWIDYGRAMRAKVHELGATLEEAHEATGIFGVDEPMSLLDSIHALKAKLEEAERTIKDLNIGKGKCFGPLEAANAQAAALAEALEKTLPYCVADLSDGELSTVSAALQTYREGR